MKQADWRNEIKANEMFCPNADFWRKQQTAHDFLASPFLSPSSWKMPFPLGPAKLFPITFFSLQSFFFVKPLTSLRHDISQHGPIHL